MALKNKGKKQQKRAIVLGALFLLWGVTPAGLSLAQTPAPSPDEAGPQAESWVDLTSEEGQKKLADEPLPLPTPSLPKGTPQTKPDRPLDLPSLPGRAAPAFVPPEGPSTEEENEAFLKNKMDWQSLDALQAESKPQKNEASIRFATLPNRAISAIPDVKISKPALDRQAGKKQTVLAQKPKPPEAQPKPLDACDSLAEMRRRQLEAAESDRKTLAALREALADLGLVDKLSFMAKGDSTATVEPGAALMTPTQSSEEAVPVRTP